jgi:hypothetical protein
MSKVGGLHEALDQDVTPRASIQNILAAATDQDVVPGTAKERVVAGATDQNVSAITAVEDEFRAIEAKTRGVDNVVATKSSDPDRVIEVEVIDHDLARKAIDHQRAVLDR